LYPIYDHLAYFPLKPTFCSIATKMANKRLRNNYTAISQV
jgi:hypothetical protein